MWLNASRFASCPGSVPWQSFWEALVPGNNVIKCKQGSINRSPEWTHLKLQAWIAFERKCHLDPNTMRWCQMLRLKWAQTSVYESIFLLRRSLMKLWGPQGDSRLKNYLFCALLISSTKRKSRRWIFQCWESNRCQLQGPLLIKMNHVEGSEFQKQAEIQDLYLQI